MTTRVLGEAQRRATLKALPSRTARRRSGDVKAARWLECVLRELASKAIVVGDEVGPA